MKLASNTHSLFAVVMAAMLVTACGGSSGDDTRVVTPAAAPTVPASALSNASAYSAYTATALTANDGEEPLVLPHFDAPSSELAEPDEVTN